MNDITIQTGWEWNTHQPVIQLMLEMFEPKLIVELGTGLYSTPLFVNYNPDELICIENDQKWIDKIAGSLAFKENHSIRFHDVPDIWKISDFKKAEYADDYRKLRKEVREKILTPKLLFVDNLASLRHIAICVLHKDFDIIVHHDSQPGGCLTYSDYIVETSETHNCFILKTPKNWTTLLLKKVLKYTDDQIIRGIHPFLMIFCIENNLDIDQLYLEKL